MRTMPYIEHEKVDEKTRARLEDLLENSYASYWKRKGCLIFSLPR